MKTRVPFALGFATLLAACSSQSPLERFFAVQAEASGVLCPCSPSPAACEATLSWSDRTRDCARDVYDANEAALEDFLDCQAEATEAYLDCLRPLLRGSCTPDPVASQACLDANEAAGARCGTLDPALESQLEACVDG